MDIARVALGGLGKLVDIGRDVVGLGKLAGDAADTMRCTTGGIGFVAGGAMNVAERGEYARG